MKDKDIVTNIIVAITRQERSNEVLRYLVEKFLGMIYN